MISYTRFGVLFLFLLLLVVPATAHAEALLRKPTGLCPYKTDAKGQVETEATGEAKHLQCVDGMCEGTSYPCNYSLEDIQNTAVGVVNWVFGIIGIIVLVMFIYGGTLWLVSGGNSSNVEKGRSIMVGSVIGVLLIFSAGAIVKFFLRTLGGPGNTEVETIISKLPLEGNNPDAQQDTTASVDTSGNVFVCNCTTTDKKEHYCGNQAAFNTDSSVTSAVNQLKCRQEFLVYLDNRLAKENLLNILNNDAEQRTKQYEQYKKTAKCSVVQKKQCPAN